MICVPSVCVTNIQIILGAILLVLLIYAFKRFVHNPAVKEKKENIENLSKFLQEERKKSNRLDSLIEQLGLSTEILNIFNGELCRAGIAVAAFLKTTDFFEGNLPVQINTIWLGVEKSGVIEDLGISIVLDEDCLKLKITEAGVDIDIAFDGENTDSLKHTVEQVLLYLSNTAIVNIKSLQGYKPMQG